MNSYYFRAADELGCVHVFTLRDFPLMLNENCFTLSANQGSPILLLSTLELGGEVGSDGSFRKSNEIPRFKYRSHTFDFRAFLGTVDGMAVIGGVNSLASAADIQQFSGLSDDRGTLLYYGDFSGDFYLTMKGGEPVWTSFRE